MAFNVMLTAVSLEIVVLEMLGVFAWLVFSSISVPTIDPHTPRSERPPLHLEPFFTWLNAAIDNTVINLAPRIICRPAASSFRFKSSARYFTSHSHPTKCHQLLQRFICALPLIWHSVSCKRHFVPWRSRHRFPTQRRLLAMSAVTAGVARAHQAASTAATSRRAIFDSDSFDILVDGGATSCISNGLSDCVKPPQDSTVKVKGFNGTTSSAKVGTVIWNMLDNTGKRHALKINNMCYVPACLMRLLSPQHCSQQENDLRGTCSTNYGDRVLLVWNPGRFKATMSLSIESNVGVLRSAPGHQVFSGFIDIEPSAPPTHFCCPVISDNEADELDSDDDDEASSSSPASLEGDDEDSINTASTPRAPNAPRTDDQATPDAPRTDDQAAQDRPDVIPFDLDHDHQPTNLEDHDDITSKLNDQSELLRWHTRPCHLPFANLRLMAAREEIPRRLAACRIPKCQSCLHSRATKRAWRTKGQASHIKTVTKPGQCVSVDQLESPVAGFVGQNKGSFFRKRYKVTTAFVDHFSRLSFVCLQESTTGAETLLAKRAFEAHAASFGVAITNYHADNGRFAERLFLEHATLQGQTVSLWGVSAHFQNGIAEKRIRDLTERA
jgi:hypothetical protein